MINNYFSSGSVYVIDDQFNEAQPIINTLYKEHIPHIYMDGKRSSLPKNPEQIRLLFLDLNLNVTLNPTDQKSFKNLHAGILNKILANKSGSYLILIWSKQQENYLNSFKEIFTEEEYNLQQKSPLEIIPLDKQDFFEHSITEDGATIYNWKEEKEEVLLKMIQEKLSSNEAFKTLSSWETIIRKSGNKTVDYLFEIVQNETNKLVALDEVITALSISYLGFENFYKILKDNNQSRTDGFLFALTELIDDEIEKEIFINSQKEFSRWLNEKDYSKLTGNFKAKLNSKLLTSNEKTKKELTGSIFKVSHIKHSYIDILTECIDLGSLQGKITEFNKGKIGDQIATKETYLKKNFNRMLKSNDIIPIELNLTPLCDIVQKKEKYYRLVPGFLIKSDYVKNLKKVSDRSFYSPGPLYLEEFEAAYMIVLDYRFFHSVIGKDLNKLNKIFSLRKNFVDDIQLKLSNHVSRLGVLYL